MAEQFLEEIYTDSILYFELKKCLEAVNQGKVSTASDIWNKNKELIEKFINKYKDYTNEFYESVNNVRASFQNPMLLAAVLEEELLPLVKMCIEKINPIEVSEGDIIITSSKTRFLTMQNINTKKFYHSLIDPMWEAYEKAKVLYSPDKTALVIMGIGFGYLAYQIYKMSEETMDIFICETDINKIEFARSFGVLDWINEENIHIIVNENEEDLLDDFVNASAQMDSTIYTISSWIPEEFGPVAASKAKTFINNQNAFYKYKNLYSINYRKNNAACVFDEARLLNTINEKIFDWNRESIIVAAGPSLDEQIEFIKESKNKRLIIAVNTVFRRLLKEGIYPDIVAVLDPTDGIMPHIKGLESETGNVILVAESSAYWKYVDSFNGERYRINALDSKDEVKEVEQFGRWTCGGTVSALAMEIAIKACSEKIYLVGLDLAFPGDKSYADNLSTGKTEYAKNDLYVRSTNGQLVRTSSVFNDFRIDIEKQISSNNRIKFFNLSEKGALIKGTLSGKWWEKLPNSDNSQEYLEKLIAEKNLYWTEKNHLFWNVYESLKSHIDTESDNGEFSNIENAEDENKNCASAKELCEFAVQSIYEAMLQDDSIYSIVLEKMNMHKADVSMQKRSNAIYLLSTGELLNNPDRYELMLRDACILKEKLNSPIVIIVTNEYHGGEEISTETKVEWQGIRFSSATEMLEFEGHRIPCIIFDENMPFRDMLGSYLDVLLNTLPREVIAYDRYSLVAKVFQNFVMVENKYEA